MLLYILPYAKLHAVQQKFQKSTTIIGYSLKLCSVCTNYATLWLKRHFRTHPCVQKSQRK